MREILDLKEDWLFHLGDLPNAYLPEFDDEKWQAVEIPHDWSIEGPLKRFRDENFHIFKNLDGSIGYLPQGIGWYRKNIIVPKKFEHCSIFIAFDGVYRDSDVWINGHHLGHRMYGYISFYYDLTPHIKFGGENVIAVRVDNYGLSSRWYAGSGIYRKVRLIIKEKTHIDHWGIFAFTTQCSQNIAKVKIRTNITAEKPTPMVISHNWYPLPVSTRAVSEENKIINKEFGKLIAKMRPIYQQTSEISLVQGKNSVEQEADLQNPLLWSPDAPNLYLIRTELRAQDKILDEEYTIFGVRTFRFDPNTGFYLNEKNYKFKGVCLHHDDGALGAKVFKRAKQRKLQILKEMGCNAIRTSHNPPSEELLDYCDLMGFMVMDEIFDEWVIPKRPFGYSRVFETDHEKDLREFVRRDRNHPCVIIWSCGNEVEEQKHPDKIWILKQLLKLFREEDPTRPVTQGCNHMEEANATGFADLLDIAGYNYYGDRIIGPGSGSFAFRCKYDEEHQKYPNRIMIGSENCSSWNTRGIYSFPVGFSNGSKLRDNFHCSGYDVVSEIPLIILKTRPYVCGMFTWTGFDYIGEPTPYDWPQISSVFGLIDLCGFPKDCYYLYQSQWSEQPMIHVFPHWNWRPGMKIPVWVYTNCEKAELYLNGRSLGIKSFDDEDNADILHLEWEVPWESGELKAVGYKDGQISCSKLVKTSREAFKISLSADRLNVEEKGDLVYITATIVDENNVFVPTAEQLVQFSVKGPGTIIGVCNGNPISHEPFVDDQVHAFNGMCLAILQTTGKTGFITIKATNPHLKTGELKIELKNPE